MNSLIGRPATMNWRQGPPAAREVTIVSDPMLSMFAVPITPENPGERFAEYTCIVMCEEGTMFPVVVQDLKVKV